MKAEITAQLETLEAPQATTAPQAPTLEMIAHAVREDSQKAPREFLDEVVVPRGGE